MQEHTKEYLQAIGFVGASALWGVWLGTSVWWMFDGDVYLGTCGGVLASWVGYVLWGMWVKYVSSVLV